MTTTVRVDTDAPYDVRIGADALSAAPELVQGYSGAAVVTDETVAALHLERLGPLARGPVVTVAPGEGSKCFATLERVLDELAAAGLDRGACLVALGGGVVGDLTGLAASLYKRGVAFVQCATTLLAQVDASVGGKTAVNLAAGKNLAGTFHQPAAVFADVGTLSTLPEHEFLSGLGEVFKSALLDGEDHLAALEADGAALVTHDLDALERAVERCVAYKARVVAADPREGGLRKSLNLGHTFGHAIEHLAGYGAVPHGVAVAAGIGLAFEHAERAGVLADAGFAERARALANVLGLPSSLAELEERHGIAIDPAAMRDAMRHDKKNRGGEVLLVLPVRAGEVALDVPLAG